MDWDVAHSYVAPDTLLFHIVEPCIVKYALDPRGSAPLSVRLKNITARGDNLIQAWNVQDWEPK
jgi:hypothetical protein